MPIEPMQIQPLELADFSGGLTDNWFDSGPTRYAAADNFLITVDRKLQMRPGTIPFDPLNYLLPGQPRRVDSLFTYINESKLLVNQGRDVFVLPDVYTGNQTWQRVTGPSGNEAIGAGQIYAQTTMGEFAHQLYFNNDSQPIPTRIYRDQNNIYQVRTAGLPRVYNQPLFTNNSLLVKCITNANAIRTAMINHMNDQAFQGTGTWSNNTQQHYFIDKYSLCYLTAETFQNFIDPEYPGPVPLPTPAGAAVDLPSLLTLVGALNLAYTHHISAGALTFYHFQLVLPPVGGNQSSGGNILNSGPNAALSQNVTPTTLVQAAAMLDDLYQKFFWHMYAVNLHGGPNNSVAIMGRYDYTQAPTSITKIGATGYNTATASFTSAAPTITPAIQDFLDYVNGLQALWNAHCGGGGGTQTASLNPIPGTAVWNNFGLNDANMHIQPDTNNNCTLPISTTLDHAFLKIFWLRTQYGNQHMFDANNISTTGIKFTNTALSANLTAVINSTTSSAITLPTQTYIFVPTANTFTGSAGFTEVAAVVSSASGTATLDRTVVNSNTQIQAYFTSGSRRYHLNYSNGSPSIQNNFFPASGEFLTSAYNSLGVDMLTWNAYAQEFMFCLFTHMSDSNIHPAANNPQNDFQAFGPTNTPGVTNWYVPTVSSLAYAFTYYTTYTVDANGIQYILESNPTFSSSIQTIEPLYVGYQVPVPTNASGFGIVAPFSTIQAQRTIPITNIPVIVNDNSTNYDTANIGVRIYRTTNGGNTFYLVASNQSLGVSPNTSSATILNGTTSYNDVQNSLITPPGSTLLNLNQVLYTAGGVVGNDQPPPSKCMHILNGTAYYGNIIQNGQYLPNTLLQSLPQNPDSAPATFTDTLEDAIVAISSTRSNIIVFCTNSVYRLSGGFNSLGQGAITHERISDTIGCVGPHSVVRTEIGIFFGGNDGFYYTDGFQLIKVSIDLNKSYAAATQTAAQKARVYGAYDKLTRRIWWSMQTSPTDTDCDMNYIFYLDYGIKPRGVFTTARNGGSLVPLASTASPSPSVGNPLNYNYWQPSAVVFFGGQLIRGDSRGLVFKTDPNTTSDPKIDLTLAAYTFAGLVPTQQWNVVPIPFNWTSSAMDFGTHYKRKYATRLNWTGKNQGNAQVQVVAISDNGRVVGNMAPINYTQNPLWGDARVTWGATSSPNFNWYYGGSADFWRRFPATTLRANLRQIQLTNAFMGIYRSEDFPSGTTISTNGSTKVVTLNTPTYPAGFYPTGLFWPLDVVDYFLATSNDGYVQTWQIAAVSGATITVLDPNGTLGNQSNVGFVIRGYKKNMSAEISAIVMRFAMFGDKTQAWQSNADSGENT